MASNLKADSAIVFKYVTARDFLMTLMFCLVNNGFVLPNLTSRRMQNQIALSIDFQVINSLEVQGNRVQIRAGLNDEIIFQLLLVSVADQIHARIQLFILHFGEGGDPAMPLAGVVAEEIIDLPRQFVRSNHAGWAGGPGELHVDELSGSRALSVRAGSVGAGSVQTI